MKRIEALEVLAGFKGDGISVATMRAIPDWHGLGMATQPHLDNIGCMGGAAPTALGIALAQPQRRVLVIDGDGSLLMQLGVLASVVEAGPQNFYHVVLVNGVYETSGHQPIPGGDAVDFPALAQAAGYRSVHGFDDLAVLRERLPAAMSEPGPVFIAIKVEPSEEKLPRPKDIPEDPAGELRATLLAG